MLSLHSLPVSVQTNSAKRISSPYLVRWKRPTWWVRKDVTFSGMIKGCISVAITNSWSETRQENKSRSTGGFSSSVFVRARANGKVDQLCSCHRIRTLCGSRYWWSRSRTDGPTTRRWIHGESFQQIVAYQGKILIHLGSVLTRCP